MQKKPLHILLSMLLMGCALNVRSQMITGTWQGKINHQKVEVKIIQEGDSLMGTSYYYESAGNYRRYSIKGYFDPYTNAAVWWDDQLIDEKSGRLSLSSPGKNALLSHADFNCPGSNRMLLDGTTTKKDDDNAQKGEVHLTKINRPFFRDEWDFVIENYTAGANDPDIIDSVADIAGKKPILQTTPTQSTVKTEPIIKKPVQEPIQKKIVPVTITEPPKALTIEEKFETRKNIFNSEIPVTGDTIELRFYDNAEVDGDSISLFMNKRLIFQHIALTEKAYIVKIPVNTLQSSNELVMVAENLGSIPPNTAYMVAIVGDKRYEARLSSDEGSSALVKFKKQ